MQISALLIGFALLVAAVAVVSRPFWEKQKRGAKDSKALTQTREQHEAVLTALRDLDFDYKTGKVSEDDYQPLRAQLMVKAAQQMEEQKKEDEQLEALIQTRRKTKHNAICDDCGAPLDETQKFCSKCGAAAITQSCPSCRMKIHKGDTFCPSCGTRIQVQMEATASS